MVVVMARYKCSNAGKFAVACSAKCCWNFSCSELYQVPPRPPHLLHLVVVEGLSALHINVLWLWRTSELVLCHLARDQKLYA